MEIKCIMAGRHHKGVDVEPNKNALVKWALLSTVAVIASVVLVVFALAAIAFGAISLASGNLFGTLGILVGAAVGVGAAFMILIARECILNAQHHAKHKHHAHLPKGHDSIKVITTT